MSSSLSLSFKQNIISISLPVFETPSTSSMADNESDVALPRFFKVFLSETSTESMAIPMSFNEHLEDPLPHTAKLQGTGGGIWTVGFSKIRDDRAYFTAGWSKFAQDHELKDGEFLTFVYDGCHTFEVSVFGRCGCKETRAVVDTVEVSDSDSDSDSSDEEEEEEVSSVDADSDEEDEDPSLDADDDSLFDEDEEVSQSIYPVTSEDTVSDDAAVVARPHNLGVTANPNFTTNLKNRIYELLIPANVVKDHGLTFGRSVRYIDGEGVIEGAKGKWSDDRICFKKWDRICRRNRLREQDTVHCEMLHVRKKVHSIKITITRG